MSDSLNDHRTEALDGHRARYEPTKEWAVLALASERAGLPSEPCTAGLHGNCVDCGCYCHKEESK